MGKARFPSKSGVGVLTVMMTKRVHWKVQMHCRMLHLQKLNLLYHDLELELELELSAVHPPHLRNISSTALTRMTTSTRQEQLSCLVLGTRKTPTFTARPTNLLWTVTMTRISVQMFLFVSPLSDYVVS